MVRVLSLTLAALLFVDMVFAGAKSIEPAKKAAPAAPTKTDPKLAAARPKEIKPPDVKLIKITNNSAATTDIEVSSDGWRTVRRVSLTPNQPKDIPFRKGTEFEIRVDHGRRAYEKLEGSYLVGFTYTLSGNLAKHSILRGERMTLESLPRQKLDFTGDESNRLPASK